MMKRRETGNLGEQLACDFLGKNGYLIIERNFRCPGGEVDIIARQKETLVFVEVRTKSSRWFGSPEESITSTKMEKLRNVAAYYWQNHTNLPESWRIDVVAIEVNGRGRVSRIELVENAVCDR
ncbi:MAG: YraN family protein [Dehalococcoidales bacterium]|jgi:putative endonuclease